MGGRMTGNVLVPRGALHRVDRAHSARLLVRSVLVRRGHLTIVSAWTLTIDFVKKYC